MAHSSVQWERQQTRRGRFQCASCSRAQGREHRCELLHTKMKCVWKCLYASLLRCMLERVSESQAQASSEQTAAQLARAPRNIPR